MSPAVSLVKSVAGGLLSACLILGGVTSSGFSSETKKTVKNHDTKLETFFDINSPDARTCKKDRDCRAVQGVCGGWIPINASSVEGAKNAVSSQRMRTKCGVFIEDGSVKNGVCKSKRCETITSKPQ